MGRVRRDDSGCWLWSGAVLRGDRPSAGGYGIASIGGRTSLLHRAMYEHTVGPIPPGLTLDHLCRVRSCVNPDHLEPVTRKENTLRGEGVTAVHARKTQCPQGHPYADGNLYVDPTGRRHCRTCMRAASARWSALQGASGTHTKRKVSA